MLPEDIKRLKTRLTGLTADMATANEHANDPVIIGTQRCLRDDVIKTLEMSLDALRQSAP